MGRTLVGLTSGEPRRDAAGSDWRWHARDHPIHRPDYKKQKLRERLVWTVVSNLLLLKAAFGSHAAGRCGTVHRQPALMLHFIAPLNLILRKKLIYRITDFHPECLIAERGQAGFLLSTLLRLTQFWRRRIDSSKCSGWTRRGGLPRRYP